MLNSGMLWCNSHSPLPREPKLQPPPSGLRGNAAAVLRGWGHKCFGGVGDWGREGVRQVKGCGLEEDRVSRRRLPPLLPPCSAPIPTPTPSRRPGGAWGGAKLPQEAEGSASWPWRRLAPKPLGSPAGREVVSPIPLQQGPPGPKLLQSQKPPLRGNL